MKKKIILLSCYCLSAVYAFCQDNAAYIAIIPEPVKLVQNAGTFTLPATVTIEAPDLPAVTSTVQFLEQRINIATGYSISHSKQAAATTINLSLNKTADQPIGTEGYLLISTPTNITIVANQPAGLFYGVQTLLQLLPKEIESNTVMAQVKWQLPCVAITDYPRFGWRGLMFDVSRHFFIKQEVKDFINQMARYKLNLFHWHLTDDEGWRVEIKSLQLLTTKGAMRVLRTGYFGNFSQPFPNEPSDYGGFYTQDDIKEVVQYAKARFVNILPEVDVPGHSMAAIVAYPELSCTPGADKYHVRAGEKTTKWHADGTFTALVDNTLCPVNEKVYVFLDKVLTELAPLFPFDYIHVGGDECSKNFWEKSDAGTLHVDRLFATNFANITLADYQNNVNNVQDPTQLMQWKLNGGSNPVEMSRSTLMKTAKINSRFTFYKCMKDLNDFRYINYRPTVSKFSLSMYSLRGLK